MGDRVTACLPEQQKYRVALKSTVLGLGLRSFWLQRVEVNAETPRTSELHAEPWMGHLHRPAPFPPRNMVEMEAENKM